MRHGFPALDDDPTLDSGLLRTNPSCGSDCGNPWRQTDQTDSTFYGMASTGPPYAVSLITVLAVKFVTQTSVPSEETPPSKPGPR